MDNSFQISASSKIKAKPKTSVPPSHKETILPPTDKYLPYLAGIACSKRSHKAMPPADVLPTSCQETERLSGASICDVLRPPLAQKPLDLELQVCYQQPKFESIAFL